MEPPPFISVIVPAHNAGEHLGACLDALLASSYGSFEIIVVDDGSTDDTARVAKAKGVALIECEHRGGPGAARNEGARHARGSILFFIDADVLVRKETVGLVAERFTREPDLGALFGSYDDAPSEQNFVSQYKNLFHHLIHQQARKEASTFWAGCGAVRKKVFDRVGGFDPHRYPAPSIEDIELGCRIRDSGSRILLYKGLQVKHLKRWTLLSMLRADILHRAVPWSMLMLERGEIVHDLNLRLKSRLSTFLVGLMCVMLCLAVFLPAFLYDVLLLVGFLVVLNLDFYVFLYQRKGLWFLPPAFLMQTLYYFYCGLTSLLCWSLHLLARHVRRPPGRRRLSGGSP
jgi:glycosyltransferase involved in cell wall biosynthesis